ncbi:MAG: signal peptide peptidase SppA [Haloferacaceae archaeon]
MVARELVGRGAVVAAGVVLAGAVGWALFVLVPDSLSELLGVALTVALAAVGGRVAAGLAARRFPSYNVAEVSVSGPIARDGGEPNPLSFAPVSPGADEVVEQIERAAADPAVEALLLQLNTPGGEIVPSDDIRRAVATFEGPVVGYATDVCASGGYLVGAACDELWAQEQTLVGSIGVRGSRPNAAALADRLGVSYERFTAGEYKDAGTPLKEVADDERRYLQGLIDDFYDVFVERVAADRDLDPEHVRATEAKVFLGREAADIDLVDRVGTRDDAEASLDGRLGGVEGVKSFEPSSGLTGRLGAGTRRVAYALGAGVASRLGDDRVRFRY